VKSQPSFDYNAEREQLFTMLLSMRAEIEALKKRLDQNGAPASHVTANVGDLKREPNPLLGLGNHDNDEHHDTVRQQPVIPLSAHDMGDIDEVRATEVEDVPVKTLDETERETIESALKRNNGRRKVTAQELNISERTLYRKIKQYNLEQ